MCVCSYGHRAVTLASCLVHGRAGECISACTEEIGEMCLCVCGANIKTSIPLACGESFAWPFSPLASRAKASRASDVGNDDDLSPSPPSPPPDTPALPLAFVPSSMSPDSSSNDATVAGLMAAGEDPTTWPAMGECMGGSHGPLKM